MNSLLKKYMGIIVIIIILLFVVGCNSKNNSNTTDITTDGIKLDIGAALKNEDGGYKLYNYENGKYIHMKNDKMILDYDKNSSNYIYSEGESSFVVNSGKEYKIKDTNYNGLKLSPNGKYFSYFIDNNGLKLKIFDAEKNEQIDIKSNVSISGTLYDWYDQDTLVYYGVSNEGINGLFIYSVKEGKEELLYKIKEGYLAFIKASDDDVVFLQITLENKRQLMIINKKSKDVINLLDNIEEIYDVEVNNKKIYFTGKVNNNVDSLYTIENNNVKRLVFDFPSVVKVEKGLKITDDGDVLFIGSVNGDIKNEQIYKYTKEGIISELTNNSTDYAFITYMQ